MRIAILMVLACVLGGCGHRGPESCDGTDKRVLNDGKWDGAMSFRCQKGAAS